MKAPGNNKEYLGTKYSQHMFPDAELDDIRDVKEEINDEENKDQFWSQAMSDSNYEEKFTLGIIFLYFRR